MSGFELSFSSKSNKQFWFINLLLNLFWNFIPFIFNFFYFNIKAFFFNNINNNFTSFAWNPEEGISLKISYPSKFMYLISSPVKHKIELGETENPKVNNKLLLGSSIFEYLYSNFQRSYYQ